MKDFRNADPDVEASCADSNYLFAGTW